MTISALNRSLDLRAISAVYSVILIFWKRFCLGSFPLLSYAKGQSPILGQMLFGAAHCESDVPVLVGLLLVFHLLGTIHIWDAFPYSPLERHPIED